MIYTSLWRFSLALWTVMAVLLLLPTSAYAQKDEHAPLINIEPSLDVQSNQPEQIAELKQPAEMIDAMQPAQPGFSVAELPHDLSPWGMFMAADWVVKTVMIGLAVASLLTWTILLSKSIELSALQASLKKNLPKVISAKTLADAENDNTANEIAKTLIEAARSELHLSSDLLTSDAKKEESKEGIKERVASSLSRIEVASARRMMIGTGLLATIGAVSPFVGLFGTVWGIMNSFIGISESNTTNLAVVAPGIAEALLATALGLVAAIPATVIYNHFARKMASVKSQVSDISAGVMRLVSRDLDRGVKPNVVPLDSSVRQAKAAKVME